MFEIKTLIDQPSLRVIEVPQITFIIEDLKSKDRYSVMYQKDIKDWNCIHPDSVFPIPASFTDKQIELALLGMKLKMDDESVLIGVDLESCMGFYQDDHEIWYDRISARFQTTNPFVWLRRFNVVPAIYWPYSFTEKVAKKIQQGLMPDWLPIEVIDDE